MSPFSWDQAALSETVGMRRSRRTGQARTSEEADGIAGLFGAAGHRPAGQASCAGAVPTASAARPASSRATGTRNGEQET